MPDNTIEAHWEEFSAQHPESMTKEELLADKFVFYAGTMAILKMQADIGVTGVPQEKVMDIIQGWYKEHELLFKEMSLKPPNIPKH